MHVFVTRQNIGLITNHCSPKEPAFPVEATQGCLMDASTSLSSSDNWRKFLLDKLNYRVRPMANYVELMNVP